jgi:hypothetical protein
MMLINLVFGIPTMVVCLMLQSLLIVYTARFYASREQKVDNPSMWPALVVISSVMVMLVVGNLIQLTIWAGLFLLLGEFSTLSDAIYHSAVNFSTLGYGDIVMSDKHKFLGPLESVNGVLMIGVSTAALTTVFRDAIRKTINARKE